MGFGRGVLLWLLADSVASRAILAPLTETE